MPPRRPVALGLAAALAFGGCSTSTPTSVPLSSPTTSAAAQGSASAQPAASVAPSMPSLAPSAAPTNAPSASAASTTSPTPSAAAGGWRIVAPPLKVPAAYLDFGFAGNGDALVVGTDNIAEPKLAVWIARYSTDGTLKSKKAVDRRVQYINGDWVDVDPSDDTVVFFQFGSAGHYASYTVASATGKTVASATLASSVASITVDDRGRTYASTPTYATSNVRRPCLLSVLKADGGIASGIDGYLEECETHTGPGGTLRFTAPYELEVARSGHVVLVDQDQDRNGAYRQPRIAVVKPGWTFVRSWPLPFEWTPLDPAYGLTFFSFHLAASGTDEVFLGETLVTNDGSRSDGYRVRHFGRDGTLLETLGKGGDQAGVTWPSCPSVDADDRLWVIDLDTAAKAYSVKVRE